MKHKVLSLELMTQVKIKASWRNGAGMQQQKQFSADFADPPRSISA
jgi:hypothetical protein